MKKIILLSSIMVLLMLAACGNNDSNNNDNSASAEEDNNVEENVDNNAEENAVEVSGDAKVMKMHSADPDVRPSPQALYEFKEIVERETGGLIEVEVYHSAQLGGDRDAFEGMQIGTIEGAVISTGVVAGFLPEMGVFDLPFIFPDLDTAYEILDGEIGQDLLDELSSQGVVGLGYWENGMRHLTNSQREVKTLEDLAGLDIRTMESQIHLDLWSALGANPTPVAWPETFAALQQGVVDGQENPAGNVTSNNLYEVQDYLTKTGHVYAANPFMVSETFWNTLTDEEQEIVRAAAVETTQFQRDLATEEENGAYEIIEAEGMLITELTEEEADKFFEAVQPVYEDYADEIGQEIIDRVLEAR